MAELRTLNPDPRRLVLITAHRRENWGAPFESICRAVRRLAERWTDCRFVFPVHPNPALRESADAILGDVATDRLCSSPAGGEGRARGKPDARLREGTGHRPRVALLGPTPYVDFVGLLNEATLVLTDSGGVQEEAAALGRPALVLRETTERPEAVEAGAVCLVGTNEERIVEVASTLLSDPERYASMARATDCFGDGRASRRIVAALENVATGSLLVGRRAMPLDLALPHGAVGVS